MGKVPGLGRGGAGTSVGIPPNGSPPVLARPPLDSFIPASSAGHDKNDKRMSLRSPFGRNWQKAMAEQMLEHVRLGKIRFDALPPFILDVIIKKIRHLKFDHKGLLEPLFRSKKMLLRMARLGILFPGPLDSSLKRDKEFMLEVAKRSFSSVISWYLWYEYDYSGSQKIVAAPEIEVFKDLSFQKKLSEANFNIYPLLKYLGIPVHPTVEEQFLIFNKLFKKLEISHASRLNTKVASEIVMNRTYGADTRPTALLIYNKYDYNGAFELTIGMMESLIDQGYRVVYHEVGTDDELRQTIISEGEKKPISLMVVAGHGNPKMTVLGKPDIPAILPKLPIFSGIFRIPLLGPVITSSIGLPAMLLKYTPLRPLAPILQSLVAPAHIGMSKFLDISDGKKMKGLSKYFEKGNPIVLLSCSTGKKERENLKDFMAGHFPESRIFAPLHDTMSTSYFKFGRDHRVEDFVFIYN